MSCVKLSKKKIHLVYLVMEKINILSSDIFTKMT